MLLAAKAAGEALIEAKKQMPHGQFKQWVESNTSVSYATAAEYMRVARIAAEKNLDLQTFDAGIRAFLDTHRERTNKTAPATNLPTFTEDDAEYALKIAARMNCSGPWWAAFRFLGPTAGRTIFVPLVQAPASRPPPRAWGHIKGPGQRRANTE